MITTAEALRIKNATVCAGCGAVKATGDALCPKCRRNLTPELRDAVLFARPGGPMELAIERAVQHAQQAKD